MGDIPAEKTKYFQGNRLLFTKNLEIKKRKTTFFTRNDVVFV